MNRAPLESLEPLVRQAVGPIFANPARRRAMREELLSHLLASYEEERAGGRDPDDAARAALHRLGDPADLRRQLQSAVPLVERLFFQCLSKETLMSRWIWFLAVFAFFFGPGMVLPALARHKQQGVPWFEVVVPLAIGLAITLAGLGTIVFGIIRRLARRTAA